MSIIHYKNRGLFSKKGVRLNKDKLSSNSKEYALMMSGLCFGFCGLFFIGFMIYNLLALIF